MKIDNLQSQALLREYYTFKKAMISWPIQVQVEKIVYQVKDENHDIILLDSGFRIRWNKLGEYVKPNC